MNDFFKGINEILKQDISKALKNVTNVAAGDKFTQKGNHSESQITVQKFTFTANEFPVIFKSGNKSVTDDKEITLIKGDVESASIYKIENNDDNSSESESESSEESNENRTTEKSKNTKTGDEKLTKKASTQPILLTSV